MKRTTTVIFENMPLDRVARMFGVHEDTVRRWIRKSEDGVVRITYHGPEQKKKPPRAVA